MYWVAHAHTCTHAQVYTKRLTLQITVTEIKHDIRRIKTLYLFSFRHHTSARHHPHPPRQLSHRYDVSLPTAGDIGFEPFCVSVQGLIPTVSYHRMCFTSQCQFKDLDNECFQRGSPAAQQQHHQQQERCLPPSTRLLLIFSSYKTQHQLKTLGIVAA
jgi:hypothetical protein